MLNNLYIICLIIFVISFCVFIILVLFSLLTKFGEKIEKFVYASIIVCLTTYIIARVFESAMQPPKSDISTRIENLSSSLTDISTEIEDIQSELTQRVELVAELKKEAEIAENVISLSDDQVTAIQAKLKQELDSNSGKNFKQDIILNVIFFILGFAIPWVINSLKKKSSKTNKSITSSPNSYSEEEIAQAIELLDTIKKEKK